MSGLRVGPIGGVFFTPTGTGAVERAVQDKLCDSVWVHAKDFGAVADGVTPATTAFNNIAACSSTEINVILDEGTYYFPRTSNGLFTGTGTVVCPRNIKFWGKGKGKTILAEGQTTVTFSGNLFWLNSGVSASFNDLTIQGPLTMPTSGSGAPTLIGVHFQDNAGYRHVQFNNVDFTGWFVIDVQKTVGADAAGKFLIEARNCDFHPYQNCISGFSVDGVDGHIHAFDCNFLRGGVPSGSPGFPFHHALYIHPHINIHFERCTWPEINGNKFALHHFSGAGKTSSYAKYARAVDCDFRQTAGVPGAVFEQSDIIPLEFERCRFGGDGFASLAKPVGVIFRDCGDDLNPCELLLNDAVGGGVATWVGGVWKQRVGSLGNSHNQPGQWTIKGTKIVASVNNSVSFVEVKGTGDNLRVEGVECVSTLSGTDRAVSAFTATAGAGDISITGGSIRGIYGLLNQAGLFQAGGTFTGTVRISNVDASRLDSSTSQFVSVANTIAAGTVRAMNCSMSDSKMFVQAGGNYQLISGNRGVSPTSIASAASISPTYQYDAYTVTGVAAIGSVVMNGDTKSQAAFTGTIRLIALGAWSTTAAGNIRPRTTAARTVNEVVTLTYDPVTALWYE